MNRYARQMVLPNIGAEGQARLQAAHALVVGAGGLGCPVLQYLAGAGVGRITLIDPDHVEETNLHRQPLYRMSDIGAAKAHAAKAHLQAMNPHITLVAHVGALHPGNADQLVQSADIVIDAADSFAVSYILSDVCARAGVAMISASVLGRTGYVGGFCGSAPSLRAVFPAPPDNSATCSDVGVMGPVVGMIGAAQAQMALQVLLQDLSPLGQMLTLDMQGLRFGGFAFHGAAEPQFAAPFVAKADLGPEDQILELRDESSAPGLPARHALRWSPERIDEFTPAPQSRVVLCCATGLRAWRAAARLNARGFHKLALLAAKAEG